MEMGCRYPSNRYSPSAANPAGTRINTLQADAEFKAGGLDLRDAAKRSVEAVAGA